MIKVIYRFALVSSVAFVLCLSLDTLAIDPSPNLKVGFGSGSRSHRGDIDSTNLMTGANSLRIPLGQRFSVNGGLDYGFSLIYSSNIWRYDIQSSGVVDTELRENFHDAGMGWKVNIPRLYAPDGFDYTPNDGCRWFVSTWAGGSHHFDESLNRTLTTLEACPDEPSGTPFFTRDGSYLRLKITGRTGDWCNGSGCTVEHPNGRVEVFKGNDGLLSEIRDAYGNTITVSKNGNVWTFSDGHRSQTLTYGTATGCSENQLKQVSLTAFGGATATYNLHYTSIAVDRHYSQWPAAADITHCFLDEIEQPDDRSYFFTYADDNQGSDVSGIIKSVTFPEGGRYEWEYQGYELNSTYDPRCCTIPGNCSQCPNDWTVYSDGVKTKKRFDSSTDSTPDVWTYTPTFVELGQEHEDFYSKTVVRNPDGNEIVNYFWLGYGNLVTKEKIWAYGLPLRLDQEDGGRYLSQEIYDGLSTNPANLMRKVYLEYETDLWGPMRGNSFNFNHRVKSRETVYLDDLNGQSQPAKATTVFADFDGMGHHRETVKDGEANLAGSSRTTKVNYNPGKGTLDCSLIPNSGCTGVTLPGDSDVWLLDLFDSRSVSEGNETAHVEYCFNAHLDGNGTGTDETPFLLRERTLKRTDSVTPLRTDQDILKVYTEEASGTGNRVIETYHGGDVQPIATGSNLCQISVPTSQYRIDHSYQYGSLKTSKYVCSGTTEALSIVDNTIDQRTGLISATRDPADFQTSYEYDLMGRLTWAKPAAGGPAWMEYDYDLSPPQKVKLNTRKNGSKTNPILIEEEHHYDGLGRRTKIRSHLPPGWSKQEFNYDSMGRLASRSEIEGETETPHWTTFQYDFLGRTTQKTLADGSIITYGYDGKSRKSRSVVVRTPAGDDNARTIWNYDRHSRLVMVEEKSNPTPSEPYGAPVDTFYEYDVLNKLDKVSVDLAGRRDSLAASVRRTFDYDGRGFLKTEDHPETPLITYDRYDAIGNVGERTLAGDTAEEFSLSFRYESAGRLTQIWRNFAGATPDILLKEFFYDSSNSHGNSKGKLVASKRHNYLPDPNGSGSFDIVVTEELEYGELGGLLSQKTTRLSRTLLNPSAQWHTTAFAYDDSGGLLDLTYPGSPSRTLHTTWSQGQANSVSDGERTYASSIDYHDNGMLASIDHGNGVEYLQKKDANGMSRIGGMELKSQGSTVLQLEDFGYDGAGNLFEVPCISTPGAENYAYDLVSRVVQSNWCNPGSDWTYEYDAYGNLEKRTDSDGGTNNTIDFGVDASTNRLLAPFVYDVAGNMRSRPGPTGTITYRWDAFNMMSEIEPEKYLYAYTADDERILVYDDSSGLEKIRLRGAGKQIIREVDGKGQWRQDWIRRPGALIATVKPGGTDGADEPLPDEVKYFHPDHLGTSRFWSEADGTTMGQILYRPFGMENVTSSSSDQEPIRFTGHERDFIDPAVNSQEDNLDYMHARYYSPWLGRFLSVDPVGGRGIMPQSWNSYTYVFNNPQRFTDPNGEDVFVGNRGVNGYPGHHTFILVYPTGKNIEAYQKQLQNLQSRKRRQFAVLSFSSGTVEGYGHGRLTKFTNYKEDSKLDGVQFIRVQPKDQTIEQFEENILEAFLSYENGSVGYDGLAAPGNSNSNGGTSGVLDAAGAGEAKPSWWDLNGFNPGWWFPINLPDATANDPETETEENKQNVESQAVAGFQGTGFCSADNECH